MRFRVVSFIDLQATDAQNLIGFSFFIFLIADTIAPSMHSWLHADIQCNCARKKANSIDNGGETIRSTKQVITQTAWNFGGI